MHFSFKLKTVGVLEVIEIKIYISKTPCPSKQKQWSTHQSYFLSYFALSMYLLPILSIPCIVPSPLNPSVAQTFSRVQVRSLISYSNKKESSQTYLILLCPKFCSPIAARLPVTTISLILPPSYYWLQLFFGKWAFRFGKIHLYKEKYRQDFHYCAANWSSRLIVHVKHMLHHQITDNLNCMLHHQHQRFELLP